MDRHSSPLKIHGFTALMEVSQSRSLQTVKSAWYFITLLYHSRDTPKTALKAHRLCEYDRLQKPRNVLKMIRKNQTFDNINLWEFILLRIKCNFHRTYQESPANHFKLNKAPVQVGLILEMQCNFLPVPVQLIQLQHPFSRTFFRQKSLFWSEKMIIACFMTAGDTYCQEL